MTTDEHPGTDVTSIADSTTGAARRQRIFLAAPMSAFASDAEYRQHQAIVNAICSNLEGDSRVASVYFAGKNISSMSQFSEAGDAFLADFSALTTCDLLVLYYPTPTRSSVLVEVGIAIGRGKSILLACRRREDLVFLLQSASRHAGQHGVPPIEIWEWSEQTVDVEELTARIVASINRITKA